jgi:hypothetical protein
MGANLEWVLEMQAERDRLRKALGATWDAIDSVREVLAEASALQDFDELMKKHREAIEGAREFTGNEDHDLGG